jgi:hypothetical protein
MVEKLALDRRFVLPHRSLKKLTNEKGWKLYVDFVGWSPSWIFSSTFDNWECLDPKQMPTYKPNIVKIP